MATKRKRTTRRTKSSSGNGRKDTQPDKSPPARSIDGPYPYADSMKRKAYEATLRLLQIELLKVQRWANEQGEKIVVLFEGRDAAGKGGTIKRFMEHLNPREARVVALTKPSDVERGQWYFQRYVAHLPTRGEIVLFDRSWYNRAGVEPVMGFCTPQDYQRFIHQVPEFEAGIIQSGVRLFKLWFDVSRKEQSNRLKSRQSDPLKHWKLSPLDALAGEKWDDYTKARDGMFLYTNTPRSPWHIIRSDDKKRARLAAIRTVLCKLPYPDKDESVATLPDPLIAGTVEEMFQLAGRFMFADQEG